MTQPMWKKKTLGTLKMPTRLWWKLSRPVPEASQHPPDRTSYDHVPGAVAVAASTAAGQSSTCFRLPRWAWLARLDQRWWRFSAKHRRAVLRASGALLVTLLVLEIYLVVLLVRAWRCFGPHSAVRCSVDAYGRLRRIDAPRKRPYDETWPPPRLIITTAEAFGADALERGAESDDPTNVAVRGRCYGVKQVSSFSCVFHCSEAIALEGDGFSRNQTREPRPSVSAGARRRRIKATNVKWHSLRRTFELLCPLPVEEAIESSRSLSSSRLAEAAATDDEGDSCNRAAPTGTFAIVAVQVEAQADGVALNSQRYSLLEPVPLAAAVADANGNSAVEMAQPAAADRSQSSISPAGARSALRPGHEAAACAWLDNAWPPVRQSDFIEWMEWLLLLGFNRVLVFDDGELECVAPARDYYVDRSLLTVMRHSPSLPSFESDSFITVDEEKAKENEAGAEEEDEEEEMGKKFSSTGTSSPPLLSRLRRREHKHTVDCLEKLGRRYKYVAVLQLGEAIVPFEEASLVALLGQLARLTLNATASSSIASSAAGDAAFHFEGATYYSTFQDYRGAAGSSVAGRVLNYSRRTRLEPGRGRRIYRASSLNRSTSAARWLRSLRPSRTGNATHSNSISGRRVIHVSSLLAWTHSFGEDCFGNEGYDNPSCLEVFQDDPQWLERFASPIIQRTKSVHSALREAQQAFRQQRIATIRPQATHEPAVQQRSLVPLKTKQLNWTGTSQENAIAGWFIDEAKPSNERFTHAAEQQKHSMATDEQWQTVDKRQGKL